MLAQSVIIVLAFGFATASYMRAGEAAAQVNIVIQRQIEFSEKQKAIATKADEALSKANTAMAISAKTEANIEWIRNGQTELKGMVMNYLEYKRTKAEK
jgi:hypothetical protein